MFRGLKRDMMGVWSLARFHVPILTLVIKISHNY